MTLPWASSRYADWMHRWGMLSIVVALLAWLWGISFWFGEVQQRQLLVDRGAELSLMANAVAQQSTSMLRAVESDLRTLDLWLVTHPGADPLKDTRFLVIVDEMRQSSKGLIDPRIVSADGSLHYLPSQDGRPLANVADREYVKVPLAAPPDQPRKAFVGAPVLSRVNQRWLIPVSLKMSEPVAASGAPPRASRMALLFAAIEVDRLTAVHERMRFQPDGAISLLRTDGVVLSRTPALQSYIGRDLSQAPHFQQDYGRNLRGSFVSQGSYSDGIPRLVSYERLDDFPVTVLVSRGLDEVYATYRNRQRVTLLFSGVLTLVVLAVTLFLHRSYRARDALQAAQMHLHRLATIDELTGVFNRRAFMDAARREFERAQRYARPTALLALDIDHFKKVNDEYGHAGGDLVLQVCATRWQHMLRDHDILGRIGGEEFCILLPETDGHGAAAIAERLRAATHATPALGGSLHVSVSLGWTVIASTDEDWSAVLARADQALYKAKDRGRNRVHPAAQAAEAGSGALPSPSPVRAA